jgi:hypothetical protein
MTVAIMAACAIPTFASAPPPWVVVAAHPTVHVTPDHVAQVPFALKQCANANACLAPMALYSRGGRRLTHTEKVSFLPTGNASDFPGLRLTPTAWRELQRRHQLQTVLMIRRSGRLQQLGDETLLLPARGQRPWCRGLARREAPPCHNGLRGS